MKKAPNLSTKKVKEGVSPVRNPEEAFEEYKTENIFLLGNGESRKGIDLEGLRKHGTIIGCNALYRDFMPDILICVDQKMVREVKDAGVTDIPVLSIKERGFQMPNLYHYNLRQVNTSGCFGMKFINAYLKNDNCYMLGMDGYPGNIYTATQNYSNKGLINFGGVNKYYLEAIRQSTHTKFINVNIKDEWPRECHSTKHYEFMNMHEFKEKFLPAQVAQ